MLHTNMNTFDLFNKNKFLSLSVVVCVCVTTIYKYACRKFLNFILIDGISMIVQTIFFYLFIYTLQYSVERIAFCL